MLYYEVIHTTTDTVLFMGSQRECAMVMSAFKRYNGGDTLTVRAVYP